MASIRRLDRRVYERIAAGEVIERPANVVKELVENSLDAGATRVAVEVRGGGLDLVRVKDDGAGMDREDALLSIDRYATSKIASLEDLDRLGTLGFRGEALASIAAVSKLELVTRPPDAEVGTRISVQGGEVVSVDEVGATEGTAVEVRDLFYNVPARRRFMKGPAAEGARTTEVVGALALTRLDVHFTLYSGGREVINAPPATTLRDRAVAVMGRDTARHLLELPEPGEGAKARVTGVVGKPQLARANRSQLWVSVNGRPVDSPEVSEAVRHAYGELLFRGRWPVAVVDVGIGRDLVDVNVHPAKREVLFRQPGMVTDAIEAAVSSTLEAADIVAEPEVRAQALDVGGKPGERTGPRPPAPPITPTSAQTDLGGGVLEEDRLSRAVDGGALSTEPPEWRDLGRMPSWLVGLRPVGQVLETYIVCEGEDAVYLIDQHALAERLTYESIKASAAHGRLRRQDLLEPLVLRPTEAQVEGILGRLDILESLGFSFFVAEDGSVQVQALPAMLGQRLTQEEVDLLLQDILDGEASGTVAAKEEVMRSMSCHLSIRAGQRLDPKQVVGLLRGMAGARDPLACVHGRPTVIRIRRGDLERMFRRSE